MLAFRQRQFVIMFPQPLHVQRDPVRRKSFAASDVVFGDGSTRQKPSQWPATVRIRGVLSHVVWRGEEGLHQVGGGDPTVDQLGPSNTCEVGFWACSYRIFH